MENDREIFQRLGGIEQTLARVDERTANFANGHTDHETRIRKLEDSDSRRGGIMFGAATVGGLVASCAKWIISLFIGGN